MLELIRSFYAYNTWANNRILEMAEKLTPEQFVAEVGASFPSVRDTLVHTLSAQRLWLARFQALPSPPMFDAADFADVAAIRAMWAAIDGDTQQYLDTLSEAALSETLSYVNRVGETCTYMRWQMLLHQANHVQQHRSEVAVILTQFGHSPGNLDYLIYIDALLAG